jgi:tetratricopeptide (TPR) repeat protein
MARGRAASALADLERVPDSSPLAADARDRAGNLELGRDRARAAEAQWRRALALDPNLVAARRALSYLYAVQLRRAEFEDQFRRIAGQSPVTFEHAYFWSQIGCSIYDPAEASARLEKFLAADPDDRRSRLALFEVYLKLDRAADAERLLEALPEDDDEARAGRAWVALLRRDDARAEALLEGGRPDDPRLARVRGRLALLRRDGPSAVRHFRLALSADRDDHEALQGLAKALRLVGDADGARVYEERMRGQSRLWELVQRASRGRAKSDVALLRDLAATCEAANRPDEARAWYQVLIARNPLDADAQRALFRLSGADTR